jgi:hypothetical protein
MLGSLGPFYKQSMDQTQQYKSEGSQSPMKGMFQPVQLALVGSAANSLISTAQSVALQPHIAFKQ